MATKATTIENQPQPSQVPETGNLAERIAAAQRRDAERNRVRQSGTAEAPSIGETTVLGDRTGFAIGTGEATVIMHDLGLSNTPESHRFINRILAMEKDLNTQGMLIIGLQTEVSALKAEIIELKRRKGLPLKAETR